MEPLSTKTDDEEGILKVYLQILSEYTLQWAFGKHYQVAKRRHVEENTYIGNEKLELSSVHLYNISIF